MDSIIETLKKCYDSSPYAFALVEAIRNEKGEVYDFAFRYANSACSPLTGASATMLARKTFYEVYPNAGEKWIKRFNELMETQKPNTRTEFLPEANKYICFQFYTPAKDLCACLLTDVTENMLFQFDNTFVEEQAVGDNSHIDLELDYMDRQFITALSQVDIATWLYDYKSKKIYNQKVPKNSPLKNILELGSPEQIEKLGFIHPDDVENFRAMYFDIRNGAKSASVELRFKDTSTNEYLWRRTSYTNIFDKNGKPHHAIGTSENIHDKKMLEKHYHDELEFQNATQGDGLIVKLRANLTRDTLDLYKTSSSLYSEHRNVSYSATINNIASSTLTAEQCAHIHSLLDIDSLKKAFKNSSMNHTLEYQCTNNSTDIQWIRANFKIYQDPSSDDIILFLYAYDVTKEKNLSTVVDKLVNLENEFIAIINAKTQIVSLIVQNNKDNQAFISENDYYSDCYENIGKSLVVKDKIDEFNEHFRFDSIIAGLEVAPTYSATFPVKEADGSVGYRKWTFSYLDDSRSQIFYTRNNVTEIFKTQERQNEILHNALLAAQQASSAKSDFLSRMSHEIRTPMNAIIGMSAIALQSIGDDEQVTDCISKIGISSRFLLSLINDILDMSRIESGKMLLKSEKIPFEDFINTVNSIWCSQANAKNIDCENIVDPNVEDYYIGDPMKLQQIIINIMSNAVKFTPEHGKVTLSIHQMRKTKDNVVLRFVANDTGCGIAEEFIPHLFEPFAQEHSGTTSVYGGTGLGLAICKSLVDMMDGSINVRSIEGVGTEFIVDVKLGISEETRTKFANKMHYNFSQLKALVVDDDATVGEHALITLKEIGVTSEWVESGIKAIARVKEKWDKKEYFDLVIVDWKMPEMDGIETARRIRAIVGPDVTIIILTAYDWVSIEHEAKMAGVNLLMSKPMFKSKLISAFEKCFNEKHENEAQPQDNFDFSGKRILLAEDHPMNVEVARKLLERKGFKVEHAANGLKALQMFTSTPVGYYDAILMDIRMPEMDGLQATYNIRHWTKEDAKTIPIIAMTANAFDEDINKSRTAGMNAHLAKPIEPKLMYQTLYRYIFKDDEIE